MLFRWVSGLAGIWVVLCMLTIWYLHSQQPDLRWLDNRYSDDHAIEPLNDRNSYLRAEVLYLDETGYAVALEQTNEHILQSNPQSQQISLPQPDEDDTPKRRHEDQSFIEKDPTIDENVLPERYREFLNGQVRPRLQCTDEAPHQNMVFVKTHRTGSHTMSNILYRYSELNNLLVALPTGRSYQLYWPLRFHHSYVDKSLIDRKPPNFLINVARYHRNNIQSLMPNSTQTVVFLRNPVFLFESVFEYADIGFLLGLVHEGRDPIDEFLKDPEAVLFKFTRFSPSKNDPMVNLLHNGLLFDLGFDNSDYDTQEKLNAIKDELSEHIDLIGITEYWDESLVLLKRLMCWQVEDVVYLKQRVRRPEFRHELSIENMRKIAAWNDKDMFIYNHFNASFWRRIAQEDQQSFWDEVKQLRESVENLESECLLPKEKLGNRSSELFPVLNTTQFEYPLRLKTKVNKEVEHLCSRLVLPEEKYIKMLKAKHSKAISEASTARRNFKTIGSLGENFLYDASNQTISTRLTRTPLPDNLPDTMNDDIVLNTHL